MREARDRERQGARRGERRRQRGSDFLRNESNQFKSLPPAFFGKGDSRSSLAVPPSLLSLTAIQLRVEKTV